jgi:uncharacterized membrane protein
MKPHHFLKAIDHDRIVSAIAAAEKRTSGDIRVFISRRKTSDALHAAGLCFTRLKMNRTPLRNAVLIFVAPVSHQFAVVGDTGVHGKCGDDFWREVVEGMESSLRRGDFTEALVHGVEKVGTLLAAHFPPNPDGRNNLPDAVMEE